MYERRPDLYIYDAMLEQLDQDRLPVMVFIEDDCMYWSHYTVQDWSPIRDDNEAVREVLLVQCVIATRQWAEEHKPT